MLPDRVSSVPKGRNERHTKPSVVSISNAQAVSNELVWKGAEYPVLSPGRYMARAIKVQGPVWVRSFQRWSMRMEFGLVHEPISVSMFFNFDNDRNGPKIKRNSKYFKAWVIANGDLPRKGQSMDTSVFFDGQFFEIQVESSESDSDGAKKSASEIYARATKILSVQRA